MHNSFPRARFYLCLISLICLVSSACSGATPSQAQNSAGAARKSAKAPTLPREQRGQELFQFERVTELSLEIDEADMAILAQRPRKFVPAKVGFGDEKLDEIGLHFKGNRGMRDWSGKPSFKLNFRKYAKQSRLQGLKRLVLNAMVEDPTALREALTYHMYTRAGVPSPRAGYVRLRINGKDRGLYLALEPVRSYTLNGDAASGEGVVYEGEYGCDILPRDAARMELEAGSDKDRAALRALAAKAEQSFDSLFSGPGPHIDRNNFIEYLATSAAVADFDGYRHAHNYFLFHEAESNRWQMLPWGVDRALKRVDMSVYDFEGHLARACFASADCRVEFLRAIAAKHDQWADLDKLAAKLVKLTSKQVKSDPYFPYSNKKRHKALEGLREFLHDRAEHIGSYTSCLAEKGEHDRDGDGFGCMDCDDGDAQRHPKAGEVCNEIDDDCDGLTDEAPECACPSLTIDGVLFEMCPFQVTWARAVELCRERGAELAWFEKKSQLSEVADQCHELDETQWWIGLNDIDAEGEFRWSHGTALELDRWGKGEPDNYRCGQDCVALRSSGSSSWRDMHCASLRPFVCRKASP